MSRRPLYKQLLDKSEAAFVSAIEVYNRPGGHFRDEQFAILAVAAAELLLKAKLLQSSGNRKRELFEFQKKLLKDGRSGKRSMVVINRSGNPKTISLQATIDKLQKGYGTPVPSEVRNNWEILQEVRDNAVHFVNPSMELQHKLLEVGLAYVQNYAELSRQWFGSSLSKYDLAALPLAVLDVSRRVPGIASGSEESRLLEFVNALNVATPQDSPFSVLVRVNISFDKVPKNQSGTLTARIADPHDPAAAKVILTEEEIRDRYPLDYRDLVAKLRLRYSDFKVNASFHQHRKGLEQDPTLARVRLLDPANPTGTKKLFYNGAIIKCFDSLYTKRI